VKLVKGRSLLMHSVRSLGDLTSSNAFIFSRLASSVGRVNPVSLHALRRTARAAQGPVSLYNNRLPIVDEQCHGRILTPRAGETHDESSQSPL
jgi:hypothetical protein